MAIFRVRKSNLLEYPFGVSLTKGGFHVSLISESEICFLLLYKRNKKEPVAKLEFPKELKVGNVFGMYVDIYDDKNSSEKETFETKEYSKFLKEYLSELEYNFADEKSTFADPYGKVFSGRDTWGKFEHFKNIRRSPIVLPKFEWEDDKQPKRDFSETIIYRMNVRGFTKSTSSKVIQKGTFSGIIEKIDYLKELGITAIDFMPCQEFEEIIQENVYTNPYIENKPSGKINYWGYSKAYHFAPKASFCEKKNRNVSVEFKELVKACHKNNIEVIVEMYFDSSHSGEYIIDVMRYWVLEYHIDGVHLTGTLNLEEVAKDPFLTDTKLIGEYFPENISFKTKKHLGNFNDGFMIDMRKFLKGDEGMLNKLIFHTKNNPKNIVAFNYIADIKGFSIMDMVSYDIKHNEKNGENNQDGTDFNYSWNCGVEGATKKKKIVELRLRQLRNAYLLLFLSQGVPVISSGDEVGKSKEGNNNTYCQDNEISWFDWKLLNTNTQILDFVKQVIKFRKEHPVFRQKEELKVLDTLACGKPDVSYHGVNVWQPDFEHWRRQLGIFYFGKYAKKIDGSFDNSFYVIYNMHWEGHEFSLPIVDKDTSWYLKMDTSRQEINGYLPENEEEILKDQRKIYVKPRSIIVLIGK